MPVSRTRRRRADRLDYAALEIVGALLTPDYVEKIAAGEAPDQDRSDYHVPEGLKLRDEIARYYRIGEALWARYQTQMETNPAAAERFTLELLQQCFGFDAVKATPATMIGVREFPVRHHALKKRVPIVAAPHPTADSRRSGLDELQQSFADGGRRRSATQLLQEYLNASDGALWGLACDGATIRLMRDNVSLTRPAWIEADLNKIFADGLFADFAVLWRLIHQSRFGRAGAPVADCPLERWRERGREDGVVAREKLRQGVEAALMELGQGFLEHPANTALRDALSSGALSTADYFEELLRLVYRLIFLFAAEDRNLLHTPKADRAARQRYRDGYALGRLRERSVRRTAWDRHIDAWEGTKTVFTLLRRGEAKLGLPALGGLFLPQSLRHVEACQLQNRRFLAAIWRLSWFRPDGLPLTRVNWRDMETEEFGSVYESLLELTPRASASERRFMFAEGDETRGNKRKTTGSYYTPDPLVKLLLDRTLEPVLDAAEARYPDDPAKGVLEVTVLDPAAGSGHFLLGAARRIAQRLTRLRGDGAPTQADFQHALREVVAHCIYGVDRNPLAVELCKVALWIESLEPGKPLTFLDSHIRCGDSLVGVFDLKVLREGIPDAAYKPLSGDDKPVAKAYAKANKELRDGKVATGFLPEGRPPAALIDRARQVAAMPEETLADVARKQKAYDGLLASADRQSIHVACQLYIAAFFAPKRGAVPDRAALARPSVPLTDHVWQRARGQSVYGPLEAEADRLAFEAAAFHWPLEFPAIMAAGGFDAVIGNPPWEVSQFSEKEFFADKAPEIAAAATKQRVKMIEELEETNPALYDRYEFEKRASKAVNDLFRGNDRFRLTARGKMNTYALFAEHFMNLAAEQGGAGVILPTGIATDSTTSVFFGHLVSARRIAGLVDFENREKIFPAVDSRQKFCLLQIAPAVRPTYSFFLTNTLQLEQEARHISLSAEDIEKLNPNTKTAPIFRSKADAELTLKIYDRVPVLRKEAPPEDAEEEDEATEEDGENPWGLTFQQGLFNMASDSDLFEAAHELAEAGYERDGVDWVKEDAEAEKRRYVPLYEAKMIHHYDHRWSSYDDLDGEVEDTPEEDEEEGGGKKQDARLVTLHEKQSPTFEPSPRYWVPQAEVRRRAARLPAKLKRAVKADKEHLILKALTEWVAGAIAERDGCLATEGDVTAILGRQDYRGAFKKSLGAALLDENIRADGRAAARKTPLTDADLEALSAGPHDLFELVERLYDLKQPRWLMGWRDICRATDERTMIATVVPKNGAGNTLLLWQSAVSCDKKKSVLIANISSIVADYICRQKMGGTHLTYNYFMQNAILGPESYSDSEIEFISSEVVALSCTSMSMQPFAEALGWFGSPYPFDPDDRARRRARLDAFFAKKYGLTRDELRFILDPADTHGPDYPTETFRGLKTNEINRLGEYRTRRLVLEEFDKLTGGGGAA